MSHTIGHTYFYTGTKLIMVMSMPHEKPKKRREEEEMRKRKRIKGNVEPVEEPVKGQSGKEHFEF